MAVRKQKRAAKALLVEQASVPLDEPSVDQVEGCRIEQPTVDLGPFISDSKPPTEHSVEGSALSALLEQLVLARDEGQRVLRTVLPIPDRLDSIEQRLERQEKLQASIRTQVDPEETLSSLKSYLAGLFDVKRSGDYLELSSKMERLRTEVEDVQLQLKAQYEKSAALRLEMEEERESAARLLQAARQREKALEQNVYQLNIREEELEELALLNEELDAKMISQSEEFAKRTSLYEEEIFALKTAESDYQNKIAELELRLRSS
jgi:chromosome segregation ATPase